MSSHVELQDSVEHLTEMTDYGQLTFLPGFVAETFRTKSKMAKLIYGENNTGFSCRNFNHNKSL
jgi:hypothetical protein